jgi:hypothetical protein
MPLEAPEYEALTDVDAEDVYSATPDLGSQASFEAAAEGDMAETREAWDAVQDDFLKKVDYDPKVVEDWLPNGVDFAFTGRQINSMSVSRQLLECQMEDLTLVRNELLAHLRRSLKLRQDLEASYISVQNARFYERKASQLARILDEEDQDSRGEGPST